MKMVIAGGTGLCGRLLTKYFSERGHEIVVLTRSAASATLGARMAAWDGKTVTGEWAREIDGADVVINLSGRSVNCRYNAANKAAIYASRLDSTRAIGRAIASCAAPPWIWINAASATIYRDARDRPMDEATGEIGHGFSVDVCQKWEAAFFEAPVPASVRRVALRSAIVFSDEPGGVWHPFYWLARLGVAGPMAGGGHMVSWVHGEDYCRAVEWIVGPLPGADAPTLPETRRVGSRHETLQGGPGHYSKSLGPGPGLEGVVNIASPNPVTNREFLAAVRRAVGMPIEIPSTRWMLEIAAFFHRTETELLLKSRWVVPGKLLACGFEFRHPTWPEAVSEIAGRMRGRRPITTGSPPAGESARY